MFFKKLIIGLLSFWAFEIKRSSPTKTFSVSETVYELNLEEQKKREAKKRRERHYPKGKWQKRKDYHVKTYSYQNSSSRDRRFSNQRQLRRMYRNS